MAEMLQRTLGRAALYFRGWTDGKLTSLSREGIILRVHARVRSNGLYGEEGREGAIILLDDPRTRGNTGDFVHVLWDGAAFPIRMRFSEVELL